MPRADDREAAGERSRSIDGFRLLPRRKLPVIPPKGEPWGGLLRPATILWLGIGAVLITAVVIGVTTSRPTAPTTLDGVTAEATSQVDGLIATLPEPPAAVDDRSTVQQCVDGSDRQQYSLDRVLTPAPGVDLAAWAAGLPATYEAEGWNAATEELPDGGGTSIRLVGLNLVPVQVLVADGVVTVTSESRCTAP
ncbi:hypothetical protein ACEXQB_010340 [Herbiconiux sp. P18]|uniref:hypothetical protein n=1 Tax=Herbiconiux liangxiaofengii TaxID=3342795 RepID=UPI0035B85A8B